MNFEKLKEKQDFHAQNSELGIRILERFKNVQLRNGLYSMDHPISSYFQQLLRDYDNQFQMLKEKISELEAYFHFLYPKESSSNKCINEPSSIGIEEIIKNLYQGIIKVAGRLESLEKELSILSS